LSALEHLFHPLPPTQAIVPREERKSCDRTVLVPTHIAKAVYDPRLNAGAAYLTPNQEGDEYRIISLAELQQLSGIDPFPQLPPEIKQTILNLTAPQLGRSKGPGRNTRRPPPQADVQEQLPAPSQDGFVGGILEAIDQFGRRP
jgi:endonuclease G